MIELVEQGQLRTACNQPYLLASSLNSLEHLVGTWHRLCSAQFYELLAFLLVERLHLLERDLTVRLLRLVGVENNIAAGAALCQITVTLREVQTMASHDDLPRACMVRHGVEQHAVHIEEKALFHIIDD